LSGAASHAQGTRALCILRAHRAHIYIYIYIYLYTHTCRYTRAKSRAHTRAAVAAGSRRDSGGITFSDSYAPAGRPFLMSNEWPPINS
jgi:hypothetical protein